MNHTIIGMEVILNLSKKSLNQFTTRFNNQKRMRQFRFLNIKEKNRLVIKIHKI